MIYDRIVVIKNPDPILVQLCKGGHEFPWTVVENQVVVGPLKSKYIKGVLVSDLQWNINKYWVFEAWGIDGRPIRLTPDQYKQAVLEADKKEETSCLETWSSNY